MANIIEITDKNPLKNTIIKIGKVPVKVKTYLDVDTFVNAAHTIADVLFTDEGYRPEYYIIAKRYAVLKYLTDIELGDMGIEEVFKVTQNGWYESIERVCEALIYEVETAAKGIIDYRLASQKTSFDVMCDKASAILGQDMTQNLADIKAVIEGLDKVDEKKFVKAVIDNNIENKA